MVAAITPVIFGKDSVKRCCQNAITNFQAINDASAEEDRRDRKGANNRVTEGTHEMKKDRIRPDKKTAPKGVVEIGSDVVTYMARRICSG